MQAVPVVLPMTTRRRGSRARSARMGWRGVTALAAACAIWSAGGCSRKPAFSPDDPVVYHFAERIPYADCSPPGSASRDPQPNAPAWRQAAGSRVTWKVAIPRDGSLRLKPVFDPLNAPSPACRVVLVVDGRRRQLAAFDSPPADAVVVPAPRGGRRGTIEFEAAAPGGVTWSESTLRGRIDSKDTNVILLTIDTLGASHVSAYGYNRPTTPFLDSLAADGTLFKRPFTCSNFSIPSHASMLTGRYPQSHGIRYNGLSMNPQQLTLADILNRKSVKTAAYVNWTLLAMPRMTGQGFVKKRVLKGSPTTVDLSGSRNVYANGLRWVEAEREHRFFLWIHSQFLHMDGVADPYGALFLTPERREAGLALIHKINTTGVRGLFDDHSEGRMKLSEEELQDLVAIYDGLVRMTDDYIRGFVEGVRREGLDPVTAVIVTSDHGMLFGENGAVSHVGEPVEELQVVPLIAVMPGCGQVPGRVVDGFVETVDIAPTILSYMGVKVPRRMQGRDLLPLVTGAQARGRDHAFAMIGGTHWSCYAARSEDWLYYLEKGGGEKLISETRPRVSFRSVVAEHPDTVAELRRVLEAWVAVTPEVATDEEQPMSDEIRDMLRKSGYLKYATK